MTPFYHVIFLTMLPKILSNDLNHREQAIIHDNNLYVERDQEEILTQQRVNLRKGSFFSKQLSSLSGANWLRK